MIRRFAPEDFQEVVEIESEVFSEHNSLLYMSFYETVGDGFLVAEQDGKLDRKKILLRWRRRHGDENASSPLPSPDLKTKISGTCTFRQRILSHLQKPYQLLPMSLMTEFSDSLIWVGVSSKIGSSRDIRFASSPPKIKIARL